MTRHCKPKFHAELLTVPSMQLPLFPTHHKDKHKPPSGIRPSCSPRSQPLLLSNEHVIQAPQHAAIAAHQPCISGVLWQPGLHACEQRCHIVQILLLVEPYPMDLNVAQAGAERCELSVHAVCVMVAIGVMLPPEQE